MLRPAVISISQHNGVLESLIPASKAGILGVIHMLTQGAKFVDDKCASRAFLAEEAGMLWGVYHRIDDTADAVTQARHFLAHGEDLIDEHTLVALYYDDSRVPLGDCVRFMEVLVNEGFDPVLYGGHVLKEAVVKRGEPCGLEKYRLWLANITPGEPSLPQGWNMWWLWQYSREAVPGLDGDVDLNAFEGSEEALLDEWVGKEAMATSKPVVGVVRLEVEGDIRVFVNGVEVTNE